MCLGIPGEIVEVVDADEHLASVEVSGVRRVISTRLLADEPLEVGDWVLVHVGFAMSRIDEREADVTLDQIRKLGRTYDEELEAFMETEIV
ncbi:HypC/HybG/HupF family hydrogenase formation chaperone [Microbacterium sp. bgisy207]|jgi:hydrogenase expression/formation protein HypC|uniref:HypC/HybG/HupF family hydrogenase formation chaperone n=1 Tax=Microbacterium sp. bgisy207 TaxID=3413800 RepID=UPI003EC09763